MRLKIIQHYDMLVYQSERIYIVWIYKIGTIGAEYIDDYPLSVVYCDILYKVNRLQAIKADIDSQKTVLELVASLVLL